MKLEKQMEKIKINENGITLVILSITIIVLIILAGVTIGTLYGTNRNNREIAQ